MEIEKNTAEAVQEHAAEEVVEAATVTNEEVDTQEVAHVTDDLEIAAVATELQGLGVVMPSLDDINAGETDTSVSLVPIYFSATDLKLEEGKPYRIQIINYGARMIADDDGVERKRMQITFFAAINGSVKAAFNYSMVLANTIAGYSPAAGTKFDVTYLGQEKSSKSGNKYDTWSINPVKQ